MKTERISILEQIKKHYKAEYATYDNTNHETYMQVANSVEPDGLFGQASHGMYYVIALMNAYEV